MILYSNSRNVFTVFSIFWYLFILVFLKQLLEYEKWLTSSLAEFGSSFPLFKYLHSFKLLYTGWAKKNRVARVTCNQGPANSSRPSLPHQKTDVRKIPFWGQISLFCEKTVHFCEFLERFWFQVSENFLILEGKSDRRQCLLSLKDFEVESKPDSSFEISLPASDDRRV